MEFNEHCSDGHHHATVSLKVLLLIFALVLIGALGYFVWLSNNAPDNTDYTSPSVTQKTTETAAEEESLESVEISEELFSLTLPVGWTKVAEAKADSFRKCDAAVGQAYYYQDAKGNYFDVCADPEGRDFASDYTWMIKNTDTGFAINEENGPCKESDAFCAVGDEKLYIVMSGGDELKGHNYYFQAGNTKQETSNDLKVYRDILASFKVK